MTRRRSSSTCRGQKLNVTVGERMTGDFTASYISLMGLGEILGDDTRHDHRHRRRPSEYVAGAVGAGQPGHPDAEPGAALPDVDVNVRAFTSDARSRACRAAPGDDGQPRRDVGGRADRRRDVPPHPQHRHGRSVLLPREPGRRWLESTPHGRHRHAQGQNNEARSRCVPWASRSAAAGTAVAGRGGSPQAVQLAIASGSPDAIKAELERAEYLVCARLRRHGDAAASTTTTSGIRQVAAWWLARRGVSRGGPGADADPAGAARLDRRRATRPTCWASSHYVSSIPALAAALSNPIFSGEARARMARGARATSAGPTVVAPLTAALCADDARGEGGGAAGPAVDRRASATAPRSSPLLGDARRRACAPRRRRRWGMFHDANRRRGALVTALQNDAIADRPQAGGVGAG